MLNTIISENNGDHLCIYKENYGAGTAATIISKPPKGNYSKLSIGFFAPNDEIILNITDAINKGHLKELSFYPADFSKISSAVLSNMFAAILLYNTKIVRFDAKKIILPNEVVFKDYLKIISNIEFENGAKCSELSLTFNTETTSHILILADKFANGELESINTLKLDLDYSFSAEIVMNFINNGLLKAGNLKNIYLDISNFDPILLEQLALKLQKNDIKLFELNNKSNLRTTIDTAFDNSETCLAQYTARRASDTNATFTARQDNFLQRLKLSLSKLKVG